MDILHLFRKPRFAGYGAAVAVMLLTVLSCEDPTEPAVPSGIGRLSGNNQFSKKATQLPDPLVVQVFMSDQSVAQGIGVRFEVTQGGGSVSSATVAADENGRAEVTLTLGPNTGTNTVVASLVDNPSLSAAFTATSSDFFCPEEDPTFVRKFANTGDLFLFTRFSSLHAQGLERRTGVVRIEPDFLGGESRTTPTRSFADGAVFIKVAQDCAFSRAGDFFFSWAGEEPNNEVMKLASDLSESHLSFLDSSTGSEITMTPGSILVGCDEMGPFEVGCRDTLTRWTDATYAGVPGDLANNNAVAVNPLTEDVYFIDLSDWTLRRLPGGASPVEVLTQLTEAEAEGANGMVVNQDDGAVFILVDHEDADTTRVIVKVDTDGNKTIEFDFATRGPGAAAGSQSDLAINQAGGGILFTIDTLNNMLLGYDIVQQNLIEMPPSPTLSDPESISELGSYGERLGLVVLP